MKKYTIKAEVNAADDVSIRPHDVTNALEWMGMDKGVSPSGVFCSSMKVSVTDKEPDALYALTDISTLSVKEVADLLMISRLKRGERIGDIRLECGCDLEIDILIDDPSDPRHDGNLDYTETFTISDIRDEFTQGDWYAWAKDENGEDVLICF